MLKEKRSFLERLTGAKSADGISEEGISMPVYTDDEQEETYMQMSSLGEDSSLHSRSNNTVHTPVSGGGASESDADGQLTIDMYQTDSEIVIKSTIAGVKPEDLDVAINNDMITVKGERYTEDEVNQDNYYYQECYWGSFSRSVVLPVDVLPEKAEASLKNGILTVRLPKADTNKVKKIQVRGF